MTRLAAAHVALGTLDEWNDELVAAHVLQAMTQVCEHCSSVNFPEERVGGTHFNICCSAGKTSELQAFDDPGPQLHALLTGSDACAKRFQDNIRSYNAALSFMSVGAFVVASPGVGPPVFKVPSDV